MGCGDEKLSKSLTQTFTAHCNAMICQQVTLSGDAEWPKVADAVIEAEDYICSGLQSKLVGTAISALLRTTLHASSTLLRTTLHATETAIVRAGLQSSARDCNHPRQDYITCI